MSWSAQVTDSAKDTTNGNVNLTFLFRSADGQTQTRVVPSSTWTPDSIGAYVQSVVNTLEARDTAFSTLTAGPVAPPASEIAALQSVWGTTTLPQGVTGTALAAGDTPAQKLAKMNAWTVAGQNTNVPPAAVIAYLALSGRYFGLQKYASGAIPQQVSGAAALAAMTAANELVTLLGLPDFKGFDLSDQAVVAAVTQFLSALAADSASGITANDGAALLALGATTMPWWRSIGAAAPVSAGDVASAGLN